MICKEFKSSKVAGVERIGPLAPSPLSILRSGLEQPMIVEISFAIF
jgi:hypothetical protein